MPEMLLEPLKLELPPMWVEPPPVVAMPAPPVEAPVVVEVPKPTVSTLDEQAAQLLDDARKHLKSQGWIRSWGRRKSSTCIIGAMQEVLFVARGWNHSLGSEGSEGRFFGDPVASRALEAMRFRSAGEAIQWNDTYGDERKVAQRLKDGADMLRGVIYSEAWTGRT